MDLVATLERATAHTGQIMKGVTPDQYGAETPCSEWDVRTLANHLVGGAWMFALALAGKSLPVGDPGDLVGEDAGAAYAAASEALGVALRDPGVLERMNELPIGTVPATVTLTLGVLDTVVHGWDLAAATGQDATIPDDLAGAALGLAREAVSEQWRGPGRPFAAELPVADEAAASERLLAFLGRRPS